MIGNGRLADVPLTLGVAILALVATLSVMVLGPVLAIGGIAVLVIAIAIVEEPAVGAMVIAAFAILRLSEVATEFYGAPTTLTPVLGLIALAVAARAIRTGERPAGGARAAVAVVALIGIAVVSLVSAEHFTTGYEAVIGLVKDGAIAVAIGILLQSVRTLRQMIWILIGGGAFLSTLSVIQFFTGAYGSSFGGFAQSELQHVVDITDEVRISGPVGDPNFYAQWLVLLVPLAIDRFHDETSRLLRSLAAGSALLASIVVVITFSRGGLLGLVVVLGLMGVRHPPRAATVGAALLIGLLAIPFLPPGYVGRVAALADIGGVDIGTDPSLRAREVEVTVATEMFFDDPLTGIGYGTYQANYVDYARDLGIEQVSKPREAHNLYLETAAETGIPGLVVLGLVVLGVGASLTEGRRLFRDMGDHRSDGIGHAVGVSLVGYLTTSVFLHMAFSRPMWVLIGVALAYPSLAGAENARRDRLLVAAS